MLPFVLALALLPTLASVHREDGASTPAVAKSGELAPALLELRAADRDDPGPVEAMALACREAGDVDGEAAYLLCASDLIERLETDDVRAKESRMKAHALRIEELGARSESLRQSQDALVKDLAWAMELYSKNKKPRNTLEMAARLMLLRPKSSQAKLIVQRTLDSMEGDERIMAEQILLRGELTRPKSFLEQWRARHGRWSDADKLETGGYVIQSDIGYRELQLASRALEQLAMYYRRFYSLSPNVRQVGKTAVFLCKSEQTFASLLKMPMESLVNVRGMLRTTSHSSGEREFNLYGWDYREDTSVFGELFDTLAHEASHQYMALACPDRAPLWLNEGMACYFEGAKLWSDGTVGIGLPAQSRLQGLMRLWQDRGALLQSTLTADPDRFLTGDEYALAWSVIYFLRHYETEDGAFPFRAVLVRMIAAPGAPGASWETPLAPVLQAARWSPDDFLREWSTFIEQLALRATKPKVALDWHLAAASRAASKGASDTAREHLELALQYEDGGHKAAQALAAHAAERAKASKEPAPKQAARKDEALALVHRAYRASLLADDEEGTSALAKFAAMVDPAGFDKVAKGEAKYLAGIRTEQARMIAAGRPRTAVALTRRWLDRVLDEDHSSQLAMDLRRKGVLELRLPLPLCKPGSMAGMRADAGWSAGEEGLQCVIPPGQQGVKYFRALRFDAQLGANFRVAWDGEVLSEGACLLSWVQPQGTANWIGFCVRSTVADPNGSRVDTSEFFDLAFGASADFDRAPDSEGIPRIVLRKEERGPTNFKAGKRVRFQLSHEGDGILRLHMDGKQAMARPIDTKVKSFGLGLGFHGGDGRVIALQGHELDQL